MNKKIRKLLFLQLLFAVFVYTSQATALSLSSSWLRRHQIGEYNEYRWAEPVSAINYSSSSPFSDIVSKSSAAVVSIKAYLETPIYRYDYIQNFDGIYLQKVQTGTSTQRVSSGSGFFITSDGYILTNKHVVSEKNAIYKVNMGNGSDLVADVIYRDPNTDLAVIKISGENYPVIELGDSSKLRTGDKVIGIGNAFGRVTDSVSEGSVTALSKNISIGGRRSSTVLQGMLQTNGRLFPGDSGGPLLNNEGKAIGINTASTVNTRRPISYYIPANTAKEVIEKAGIKVI